MRFVPFTIVFALGCGGERPTPRADTYALGVMLAALDLPERFGELVERARAAEPGARYPSAAALADALTSR